MEQNFDLLIRNASIIDGSGAARFQGDIGVHADRVTAIGRLDAARGEIELDASDKVAAPGFIDAHTHDDRLMLSAGEMAPKVSQGVTTVVAGNCGISLSPMPDGMKGAAPAPLDLLDNDGKWFRFPTFGAYVEELHAHPASANCALLVGHMTLRVATMNSLDRPASKSEIARMRGLVRESLGAGAIGFSSGLYYELSNAAPAEEVVQIAQPLKEFNGIYCTHMRDEADHVLDSLDESFRAARELDVPVVISHHKVVGSKNHGRSRETLPHIARAMREQPVCLDCYPYMASSTMLSYARTLICSRVILSSSKPYPQFAGMDLDKVVQKIGLPVEQAIARLQPASAIYFSMDEADVQRILQFEDTMIGSDGLPHDVAPHPRLWGCFPRVLGHYSRDLKLFPLETAVRKMTSLPAKTFGLKDRGVLKQGAYADIVIFDPDTIAETATWEKPIQPAAGIAATIVNGAIVWQNNRPTGARSGRILKRQTA